MITGVSSPAISQQSTAPNLFEPVPANQISSFHQDLAAVHQDKVFVVDKTYGIFVDQGVNCRYTNGAETYEDSFLRLETGCGKGSGGFGGGTFYDRIWNGTLYYDGAWGEHYLGTVMTGGGFTFNGTGGVNPFGAVVTPRTWNGRLRYRSSGDLPHMTVADMVAGGTGILRISNCTPGGNVHAAYSLNGGGPTSSAWGTVYMTPPWKKFPTSPFTADPNGEVEMTLSPPASMSGRTVWLQCLDWGSATLSNGVATTIL